ncbi:MAG TPA: hypothetical protein VGX78_10740 [Pirellulales bacterium]|nr:hypothetical protein [Pirellulales bacterium]
MLAEVAPNDPIAALGGPAAFLHGRTLGGSPLRSGRPSRWDSPWYLMGVGTLLASGIIAVGVACYFLFR